MSVPSDNIERKLYIGDYVGAILSLICEHVDFQFKFWMFVHSHSTDL